jgi:hypothetical protein
MRIDKNVNVLKYANGFDPNRGPIPQSGSPTRPAEFFLDFDPVCPGWPPGQQDSLPAHSDTFASGGAEAAVITHRPAGKRNVYVFRSHPYQSATRA